MVCIAAWEPFDVSIDVGTVFGKLKSLHHDLWQYNGLVDEGISMLHNALFAAAGAVWLRTLRVRQPAMTAALLAVPLVCALEASQLFITSRMPGVEDAAVASLGIVIGALFSKVAQRIETRWGWVGLVAIVTALSAAMEMLNPFEFTTAPVAFAWLPFESYYIHTTFDTLSHVIEIWLLYAPLGYFLGRACRTPSRGALAACGLSFLIAAPIEVAQHWIAGRYPDVTDIVMSLGGACLGVWAATSGARMFRDLVSEAKSVAAIS
jgi:glycopeptide antibiotics resistance protein